MNESQHPDRVLVDGIDQAVARVGDQLACVRDKARLSHEREISQPSRSFTEQLVHAQRSSRVVGCDIVHDVRTVLFGFRGPENDHREPSVSLARLAAKSASTASWLRPSPSSIEARALPTLRPRYAL